MKGQLALSLYLRDDATFANFYAGSNQPIVDYLTKAPPEKFIYLYGQTSVGKTHLLQACCQASQQDKQTAVYLPLQKLAKLSPALVEGMENLALICIDDIAAIAGLPAWEEALFHLYNRVQSTNACLIIAAAGTPHAIKFSLEDLRSRLTLAITFQLSALTETEKIIALQLRAKQRGLLLSAEVSNYILAHFPRDMHSLFALIEKLDHASLSAQRRLTLPFVRDLFNENLLS